MDAGRGVESASWSTFEIVGAEWQRVDAESNEAIRDALSDQTRQVWIDIDGGAALRTGGVSGACWTEPTTRGPRRRQPAVLPPEDQGLRRLRLRTCLPLGTTRRDTTRRSLHRRSISSPGRRSRSPSGTTASSGIPRRSPRRAPIDCPVQTTTDSMSMNSERASFSS